MKLHRFLIVTATGECRVVTRWPRVRSDEVAYRLHITIPDSWGRVFGVEDTIDIELPEPPEVEVGDLIHLGGES